jgi:hypothetical protein
MYLYGDGTESPLRSNFLEFMRGAIDFGVYLLLADASVGNIKRDIVDLERGATEEISRLEALEDDATNAIEKAQIGAADSVSSKCAAELGRLVHAAVESSIAEVRANLALQISEVQGRETLERDGCVKALERLLLSNEMWDAVVDRRILLHLDTMPPTYGARTGGVAGAGLAWLIDLAIPDGHLFGQLVRLERLMPVEVSVPDLAGWLKKEVRSKAQRLDKLCINEVFMDHDVLRAKLRIEPGSETGYDVEVHDDVPVGQPRVRMARTGTRDSQLDGPFDVRAEDEPTLIALAEKLREALEQLPAQRLVEATFDDAPFARHAQLRTIVDRLVSEMAPMVREISGHSLSPNELVIKRLLGDDRREEVFVSKASLREKLAPLSPSLRAAFDPLGLDPASAASPQRATPTPSPTAPAPDPAPATPGATAPDAAPAHAVTTPSSRPSPPRPSPRPSTPAEASPPPEAEREPSNGESERVSIELILLDDELTPAPPQTKLPLSTAVTPHPPGLRPPPPPLRPRPATTTATDTRAPRASTTDAVNASVQDIQGLTSRGEHEIAYESFAQLYSSEAFGASRPETQRSALRLMVKAAPPSPLPDSARRAHRAALERLNVLVSAHDDPADYELLGICQLVLEETAAASATFASGLALERKRDPGSELCENLMRRVGAL